MLAFVGVLAVVAAAHAGEFQRNFTYDSNRLTVAGLVGSVRLEHASGNEMQVEVKIRGKDADEKWIHFESETGHDARLVIQFPVDEHRRYVYPEMGHSSRTTFTLRPGRHSEDSWLEQLLGLGDRIEVRGRPFRDALEVWADVVIRVPDNRRADVYWGAGQLEAENVNSDLDLRIHSGPVQASTIQGELLVDTGSGSVDVRGVQGELSVDTGSGSVTVRDVTSKHTVTLDTGSGSVDIAGIKARELSVDTGSGGVDLADIDVETLMVDTGSGGVDGNAIGTDDLKIDTGSGGVTLDLVRMGRGNYDIETGSGGIRLTMPNEISAEFDVDTGSGNIVANIDGVTLGRRDRHEAHFSVGEGEARVTLSTGSGSVRLSQARR